MKKLLLIDGNSMLFRAYYATAYGKKMTTRSGLPTNAVFGFATMFQKALDTIKPDCVMVAFDAGKHTFRHDLYPEYKGGRKPAPDDLVPQFKMTRDYLDAYHIKWVEMQDIEADDLIGTLAKKSVGYTTNILSSDHDLLQLIDDTTSVWLMKKGLSEIEEMDKAALKETMGIVPSQIIDLKGLMGDSSDNIPGVAGIGEKTALKLLGDYDTVENLLDHTDELKGKLKEKIVNGRESALLSKRLATINTDAPIDFTAEDCRFEPDYEALITFLKSLDMNSFVARYEELLGDSRVVEEASDVVLNEKCTDLPDSMKNKTIALFMDADQKDFMHAEVHGLCFSDGKHQVYISVQDINDELREYLQKSNFIGFDIKRNKHLCDRLGISINFVEDAMIAGFLCDSTLTSEDKVFDGFRKERPVSVDEVYGKVERPVLFIDEELQLKRSYQFSRNIYEIYEESKAKLEEEELTDLYRTIELPLSSVLYGMEKAGIRVNEDTLGAIADQTKEKLDELSNEIYECAGMEFNINSPKQLGNVLYDHLGLPTGKKRSTSVEVLEKLIDKHPVVPLIMEYRKYQKIYSTYAEGLKKYIQEDGKIHTLFNQCITQTGRLSSSDPNLQNISVRDELGKEIRKAFVPEEGHLLLSSDYSQVELRILAHMANEQGLIDAFRADMDIHTKTAMDVFGVTKDMVTSLMRRQAKAVNFGIVYGISDFGLSQQLGIYRKEAQQFIDTYFEKYPGIKGYMDSIVKECEENGYVKTMLNRRRFIPEIKDKNYMIREFGKRAAMNAPIQGTAADLIKIAMIRVAKLMKEHQVKSVMLLQVHDELIFDVPVEELELMKDLIKDGMEHALELSVPLKAESAYGKTWYEAK